MQFDDALRIAGLMPRTVVADDRWHRCPTESKPRKRNGAYRLSSDGAIGWFRDWADGAGVQTWRAGEGAAPRVVDHDAIRAARERERARRIAAMRGARDFWSKARPMGALHSYLSAKRLTSLGCSGLRVSGDLLVVPVWLGEWVVSVQTINQLGDKRFWPGAPVKAGCYVIERAGAAMTVFAEGLATGLAVYQSMRSARVVVCFDAGNLRPVIERMRPAGTVVIAADNDHETQFRTGVNPGLSKAHEAAALIGCGVAYPEGIEGTDWADALIEWARDPDSRSHKPALPPYRRIERLIQAQIREAPS